MAYYVIRYGNKVYAYTYREGKVVGIPRKETEHLDAGPKCNIEAWITNYELTVEKRSQTADPYDPPLHLKNLALLYEKYLKGLRRSPRTVEQHLQMLNQYIFPFFIEKGAEDPHQWTGISYRLKEYLTSKDKGAAFIKVCNAALRGFWNFHVMERRIQTTAPLNLYGLQGTYQNNQTPLKRLVCPDEVITFARSHKDNDLVLLALFGYFFSLRPQETFFLCRKHFFAGERAAGLECCRAMRQYGLFDRFAVNVLRQKTPYSADAPCKSDSKGLVACFNGEAARLIISIVKEKGADVQLFPMTTGYYIKKWRLGGLKGITMKDLRRASLYWLGHDGNLSYSTLKNHARHKDPTTTALYLRRPDEQVGTIDDDLDLGA